MREDNQEIRKELHKMREAFTSQTSFKMYPDDYEKYKDVLQKALSEIKNKKQQSVS